MKDIVIIPTYNERENIEKAVRRVFSYVPDILITVVDDNSPDGTGDAVAALMEEFPNLSLISRQKKEGLGKAYVYAFRELLSRTDLGFLIMMDADLSHDPKYLKPMLEEESLYDVIVGSRYTKGGATEGWELWRRVLSRWGNVYCRLVTRVPLTEFTGGFNAIRASVLRKIDFSKIDMSGYAFQVELKYLLYKAGARFKEIPIVFKNRTGGESKISNHIIREGIIAPWKMIFKK